MSLLIKALACVAERSAANPAAQESNLLFVIVFTWNGRLRLYARRLAEAVSPKTGHGSILFTQAMVAAMKKTGRLLRRPFTPVMRARMSALAASAGHRMRRADTFKTE